jgi:hypothetical protein
MRSSVPADGSVGVVVKPGEGIEKAYDEGSIGRLDVRRDMERAEPTGNL